MFTLYVATILQHLQPLYINAVSQTQTVSNLFLS